MKSKRQHIVIMVDSYFPNMTMNGVVAKRISEIIEEQYDVSIITYEQYEKKLSNKVSNVHKVFFWSVYYENMFADKITTSKNGIQAAVWQIILYIKKIHSYLCRNINILGVNKRIIRQLEKELLAIHKKHPVDKVLSIAAPFEFQIANYRFAQKYPGVSCVAYQIDFWLSQEDRGYPKFLRKKRKNARLEMQKRVSEKCKMYMLPFIYEAEGKSIDEGITPCQLPLLVPNNMVCGNLQHRKVKELVFAGSLNKENRNPEKLIQIIEKVNETTPCKMNFYHRGNCAGYIHNESVRKPEIIIDHGCVSSTEAYQAMGNADALVSIGIVKGDQIAGKTFDYVSTGKKIVYIYFSHEDVNADFLQKYPLVLCLNVEETPIEDCAKKLEMFLNDTERIQMRFDEVAEIFEEALPKNVCKLLFQE